MRLWHEKQARKAVLRIRVGFNEDTDPYFYLNAYLDTGSQSSVDPCRSGSETFSEFAVTKKLNFT
jgi:hypothetical protein